VVVVEDSSRMSSKLRDLNDVCQSTRSSSPPPVQPPSSMLPRVLGVDSKLGPTTVRLGLQTALETPDAPEPAVTSSP